MQTPFLYAISLFVDFSRKITYRAAAIRTEGERELIDEEGDVLVYDIILQLAGVHLHIVARSHRVGEGIFDTASQNALDLTLDFLAE